MTNRIMRLAGAAAAAAALMAGGAQAQKITSTTYGFSAAFPCTPAETDQEVTVPLGRIPSATFACQTADAAYYVAVSTYPAGFIAKRTPAAALQDAVTGVATNVKGMIRSNATTALGKNAGREALIDVPASKAVVHLRVFFSGDRQYQAMVITPAGLETAATDAAFLNSLSIGK